MTVNFYKYQGTGNDFILIDNRAIGLNQQQQVIKKLCDRRFGIGADGLIYLQNKEGFDFEMVYFNSDGNESTMCGNGGRCLIQFAHDLGLISTSCKFWAIDGEHTGVILKNRDVSLKMKDVTHVKNGYPHYVLNTGSPHYVCFEKNISTLDIVEEARKIRNSHDYIKEGINVNYVEIISGNELSVRTYERGVEDETLSCGTGVVASALAFSLQEKSNVNKIKIQTRGGELLVRFEKRGEDFANVFLEGPAVKVFEGKIDL